MKRTTTHDLQPRKVPQRLNARAKHIAETLAWGRTPMHVQWMGPRGFDWFSTSMARGSICCNMKLLTPRSISSVVYIHPYETGRTSEMGNYKVRVLPRFLEKAINMTVIGAMHVIRGKKRGSVLKSCYRRNACKKATLWCPLYNESIAELQMYLRRLGTSIMAMSSTLQGNYLHFVLLVSVIIFLPLCLLSSRCCWCCCSCSSSSSPCPSSSPSSFPLPLLLVTGKGHNYDELNSEKLMLISTERRNSHKKWSVCTLMSSSGVFYLIGLMLEEDKKWHYRRHISVTN